MTDVGQLSEELTYCEKHPDRETTLRCNKCERYMCAACAVQTPVGYRCRECVRQVQDKFYGATNNDYLIIGASCAVAGGFIGAIAGAISLPIIFSLLLGFPVGAGIAELALKLVQRRRGRNSAQIGATAVFIGGLAGAFVQSYLEISGQYSEFARRGGQAVLEQLPSVTDLAFSSTFNNIGLLLFLGIVAFGLYGRFRMVS